MKLGKILNDITTNIRKVSRVRDGIAVECYNASQAEQVLAINVLGSWAVKCEYPKAKNTV